MLKAMPLILLLGTIIGAYLLGGVPFGFLVARGRGVNIFDQGSGNIGATNVGRVLGRRFGILVFVLDLLKGAVPVFIALWVQNQIPAADLGWLPGEVFAVGAGLAAFLGHLFPPYLRFRGGKGVATGAGVVMVLVPGPALAALLAWVAVVCASRTVSLASLAAAGMLCAVRVLGTPAPFADGHWMTTSFCLLAAGLVFLRHRANIQRLLHGTENRLQESRAMIQFNKTAHVLALGLWFGSAAFFLLVVTVSIFHTFETIGANKERPNWFPLEGTVFANHPDGPKEQGSRAAGATVGPLFDWFFPLQGICGLLATATCLSWSRSHPREKAHQARGWLLITALATVLIGWALERQVVELREPRNQAMNAYLQAGAKATESQHQAMLSARKEFALWHLASLGLSFVTLGLVTVAMALAARLPAEAAPPALSPPTRIPSLGEEDTVLHPVPQETGIGKT